MTPQISITTDERLLFDFLLKVNDQHQLGLTFRVAGGWVRDKLLGKDCHDIDIALDKMTGQQFCKGIGLHAHVVALNPEQSKHLETAMVSLFGFDIDFNNLRDESWAGAYSDGRILTENRIGTPKADAERRDLTVNALYYNVNTGEVEDFVGGLHDLGFTETGPDGRLMKRRGSAIILRTPLASLQTLADDPLRILRGFRFRAKLGRASLASEFKAACAVPDVQKAFVDRVTQERVAGELIGKREKDGYKAGILSFRQGPEAIKDLYVSGILDQILDVPLMQGFASFAMSQNSSHHKFNAFSHTIEVMIQLWSHTHFLQLPPERQALLQFAALLHDVGKRDPACTQQRADGWSSYIGHEDSSAKVARQVCNKLKMSEEDTQYVVDVVGAHMRPHSKGWGTAKTLRRFKHDFPECWGDIICHAHCDILGSGTQRDVFEIDRYVSMLTRGHELTAQDKDAPPTNKPIISGQVVMTMIPELPAKTGFIRDVNAALLDIRLENPDTTEEEYLQAVEGLKPALLIKYKAT